MNQLANLDEKMLEDRIFERLMTGRARTFDEAEEQLLDESLSDLVALIGSDLDNEQLQEHPLMRLLLSRGMRGREDSLL